MMKELMKEYIEFLEKFVEKFREDPEGTIIAEMCLIDRDYIKAIEVLEKIMGSQENLRKDLLDILEKAEKSKYIPRKSIDEVASEHKITTISVEEEIVPERKMLVDGIDLTIPKTSSEITWSPASAQTLFPSQLLSKHEPLELIGEGGFARVFKCRRKKDCAIVAVKIPVESEDAGKSFVSELNNWKKLKHNNIVELYDYNVYPYPHIEMELCDCSLADVRLKSHEILRIAYAIADALSYAHGKGIVHGDLKPSNILIKDSTSKLSDWGRGYTTAYAPPEVLMGSELDEKADIWSFGVVLYEMVKGFNPFQGSDDIETMDRVLEFEPDFSNLGMYEGIIRRCLQKERDKRFSSMSEIKRELAKINIATYSRTFSIGKSRKEKIYSVSEIISTYTNEGDFKLAKDRLKSVKKYNLIPVKIADAMLAVIEIMEMCNTNTTLDQLKNKYEFILELLGDYREEIEKTENIGVLFRKVMLYQSGGIIPHDERERIKNVFCRALLDKIKLLAYKSVDVV